MSLFPHRLLIYGEYCSHMEHAQNTLNQLLASREDFRLKVEVKGLLGLSPARPWPVPRPGPQPVPQLVPGPSPGPAPGQSPGPSPSLSPARPPSPARPL